MNNTTHYTFYFALGVTIISSHAMVTGDSQKKILNMINSNSCAPLHIAAQNGNIEVLQTLLDEGAEVDPIARDGKTPLMAGAHAQKNKVVELLLQKGASVAIADKTFGYTALHYATKWGTPEIIERLIMAGASTSVTDKYNNTPVDLAFEASDFSFVEAIWKALKQKKPLKKKNKAPHYILHVSKELLNRWKLWS